MRTRTLAHAYAHVRTRSRRPHPLVRAQGGGGGKKGGGGQKKQGSLLPQVPKLPYLNTDVIMHNLLLIESFRRQLGARPRGGATSYWPWRGGGVAPMGW